MSGGTLKQIQEAIDKRVKETEEKYWRPFKIASGFGSLVILALGGVTYIQVVRHVVTELQEQAAKDVLADIRLTKTNADSLLTAIQNKFESLGTNRVVSYDKDGKLRLSPIDGTIWLMSAKGRNWGSTYGISFAILENKAEKPAFSIYQEGNGPVPLQSYNPK